MLAASLYKYENEASYACDHPPLLNSNLWQLSADMSECGIGSELKEAHSESDDFPTLKWVVPEFWCA